jgi:hypothetical protein
MVQPRLKLYDRRAERWKSKQRRRRRAIRFHRAARNAHHGRAPARRGGSDEGLTFNITTAGPEKEGKRILRFDCFYKNPHYHVGASGEHSVHNMKDEGVEDPVRWTLDQLKTRFPAMIKQAGYEEIAANIDQQAIADPLTRLEPEILAKY